MHEIALDLLILLAGIWLVAVTLRPLGLPTVMGELIVGVLVGPAVLGLIAPGHAIELLAEIGIFFLMFHAGVETQPVQFFDALKRSLGIALAGAAVPFAISFGVAILFGLDLVGATFVGLTIGTATAVVVTLKCLKDLRLDNTRVARLILASCVINDLLTLVLFSLVLGLLSGGGFEPAAIALTAGKVTGFFAVSVLVGRFLYPRLSLPFRSEGGKGFTFVLLTAIAAGLFAEAIGLHMILGAYLAGLFFEEKVAHPNLVKVVKDRAYGIAYSFLGPIFFISLGFSVTFDISASSVGFMVLLTVAVIAGQILSAGAMALRMGIPAREAFTVGVGMCGRAEVAFILASLALAQGAIDQSVFSALIFAAFLMNLFTPLALKGCAVLLEGKAARQKDATRGVVQIDKFGSPLVAELSGGRLPSALPAEPDAVVIYGYGPEVDTLMGELASRDQPVVVIEEDEEEARRLQARGQQVVYTSLAEEALDFEPLALARAVIANGQDELNALLAAGAREHGFSGPLVALIDNPNRRAAMQLAGATAAFTPTHLLAGALAVRASSRISPRVTGAQPLEGLLEIAEMRVPEGGPLANRTLSETGIHTRTGAHIVGRWAGDILDTPPPSDRPLEPGTILVAAGSPGQHPPPRGDQPADRRRRPHRRRRRRGGGKEPRRDADRCRRGGARHRRDRGPRGRRRRRRPRHPGTRARRRNRGAGRGADRGQRQRRAAGGQGDQGSRPGSADHRQRPAGRERRPHPAGRGRLRPVGEPGFRPVAVALRPRRGRLPPAPHPAHQEGGRETGGAGAVADADPRAHRLLRRRRRAGGRGGHGVSTLVRTR